MADYTLSVDVTANDHASETFKKIQDNAKNFKSTVENRRKQSAIISTSQLPPL